MVTELWFYQIATDFDEWLSKSDGWSSKSDEWSSKLEGNRGNWNWFPWMVIKIRGMVIKIGSKLVELQLILMAMGQNIYLQILFQTHSNILSICDWFWGMVIKTSSKLVETITSKHYLTLIPISCHLKKCWSKSNHFQTLYYSLQKTSSQTKPRVWERKKDVLA